MGVRTRITHFPKVPATSWLLAIVSHPDVLLDAATSDSAKMVVAKRERRMIT